MGIATEIIRTGWDLGIYVIFLADYITNAKVWEQYTMTDATSILRDRESKSYRLIEEMIERQ
jgi:hypothetical protein